MSLGFLMDDFFVFVIGNTSTHTQNPFFLGVCVAGKNVFLFESTHIIIALCDSENIEEEEEKDKEREKGERDG